MVSRTRARVKPAALQAGQADSGSDSDSQEEGAMADTPPPPRARARAKQKRAASHALTYEAREKKRVRAAHRSDQTWKRI